MSAACPACRSGASRRTIAVPGFEFRVCARCGTWYVPDPPSLEELAALYRDAAYFADTGKAGVDPGYRDYLRDRPHVERKFEEVLAHVERLRPPGDLLDVGAGPGFLVAAAVRRGWRAVGLEPNAWAAERARAEGLDVRDASLGDAPLGEGTFDAVTLMDVIEHVTDPGEMLDEVRRVSSAGAALAVLTPDAGALPSRVLGGRWPEAQRAPEHLALFTRTGLATLLASRGFEPVGWHTVGKRSSVGTLVQDVSPVAPALGRAAARAAAATGVAGATVEIDPRTKLCMYAIRAEAPAPLRRLVPAPVRLSKRRPELPPPTPTAGITEAERRDLTLVRSARGYQAWLFGAFGDAIGGDVLEVGPGIGIYTPGVAARARTVAVAEPDAAMRDEIARLGLENVRILPSTLEDLAGGGAEYDTVVMVNVLEHIADHRRALRAARALLRPGGRLCLLVPAHRALFGSLDRRYGHWRRYSRDEVEALLAEEGFASVRARYFNPAGAAGWWLVGRVLGRRRLSPVSVWLSEWLAAPLGRTLERLGQPPFGQSVVAVATVAPAS